MKIGRNDSCPCGSFKKYKKCCLEKITNNSRTYMSNARWTKIGKSSDSHNSYDAAKGVCSIIEKTWGNGCVPCEIRGNVIETWVEEII